MKKALKSAHTLHYTSKPTEKQLNWLWKLLCNNLWMAPLMNDEIRGQLEAIDKARDQVAIAEGVLSQKMDKAVDGYRWLWF